MQSGGRVVSGFSGPVVVGGGAADACMRLLR